MSQDGRKNKNQISKNFYSYYQICYKILSPKIVFSKEISEQITEKHEKIHKNTHHLNTRIN